MSDNKVIPSVEKRKPPAAGMGRRAGVPNKVTKDFRLAVNHLLELSSPKMVEWLEAVALGNVEDGGKREPDPGKALDLMAKLAEYAAPKLARTEVTGADGGPVQVQTITRRIVDPNNAP